jgi:hypothetical protein
MPRPREELTAGEWAVLALVAEEPPHGSRSPVRWRRRATSEGCGRFAERLSDAADAAEGLDRALVVWRLESTTAAVRFVEAMLDATARPR